MEAHDLFQLGRLLSVIAEEAMQPEGVPRTPPGVRLILVDVGSAPGSSIGEIVARTGLPQSYVSGSVARLREQGVFETGPDPTDGRRTLVSVSADAPRTVACAGSVSVDARLLAVCGTGDPKADRALIGSLEELVMRLQERNVWKPAAGPRRASRR